MTTRKLILGAILAITLLSFRDARHRTVSRRFFHPSPKGDIYIVVIKSNYELQLYDKDGWYATYPAVFGSKSLDDKMVMGDRLTPEGTYHIAAKRPHEKWNKIMDLDYPTAADIEKFNERKAQGLIPKDAKIGNGIAIHGTWPHDEHAVDAYQMWTNGCVSLKNEDMDEIYRMTPVGATVTIQH
ncbi:MAG TPA: L,D-transpeptidase [Puia sp.]|jgi:murein L,D-transpeptidase YafK|nr:L,D-transpeptidase [Puia sp.]